MTRPASRVILCIATSAGRAAWVVSFRQSCDKMVLTLWLAVAMSLAAGQETTPPNEVNYNDTNPFTDVPLEIDSENSTPSQSCQCTPYYLCDDKDSGNSGEGLIDINGIGTICGNSIEVCCKNIAEVPENDTLPTQSLPLPNSCGQRNEGLPIRVASVNEAQYGEFPWMVALLQDDADGKQVYLCGGSLIHPNVVLTAAHCVQGKTNLTVRVGEWDTQTELELYPTQERKVQEVIVHEKYNPRSLTTDVALLVLESPFDLTVGNGTVGLICLPEANEEVKNPPGDCVATGWGKDLFGQEGKYSVILKQVDLPIVQRDVCQEALQKTRLGSNFTLHSSFICAGGVQGKDTCKGDGGSPLACPSMSDSQVYVQAGIVAWGVGCGTDTPAVYVNVPPFVPWIHSQLQQRNISL